MEVVLTTGAIILAKLQSNHHHQQTNIQFYYRPDIVPVARSTGESCHASHQPSGASTPITIQTIFKIFSHQCFDTGGQVTGRAANVNISINQCFTLHCSQWLN